MFIIIANNIEINTIKIDVILRLGRVFKNNNPVNEPNIKYIGNFVDTSPRLLDRLYNI